MKKCKYCEGEGWVLIRCLPRGPKNSIVQCNHCKGTGKEPCARGRSSGLFLLLIILALLLGGCALTTAEYKDGVASIRRIRVLMTEDIDSFSYDATDGSFILEGYKSDMTRLLILVDKLIARDAELRRELMALEVKP